MLIAQAPLRISLFGGGSDLPAFLKNNTGSVLSFAITRRVFLIGHPFTHRSGILLKYSSTEDVSHTTELEHPIAREVFRRYNLNDMDVAVMSDVPAGTGLGSSSSFTVACLAFVHGIKGEVASPRELANEACEIEIDVLKEPVGYQDQWASALGGINVLEFTHDSVAYSPITLSQLKQNSLQENLFLVPVGQPRSAGRILKKQQHDFSIDDRSERLTRALTSLVPQGEKALLGNTDDLGPLLNEAWAIKREISEGVSNKKVDLEYTRGLESGATGGKLLGAGGSGYLAFYVPAENHEHFSKKFPRRLTFEISQEGAGVIHES